MFLRDSGCKGGRVPSLIYGCCVQNIELDYLNLLVAKHTSVPPLSASNQEFILGTLGEICGIILLQTTETGIEV